jgi:hypothetical protein
MLWFHPAARVIASRLSLARETVVDEQTILITRDRRAYAEALLAFSNPQPHVIGAHEGLEGGVERSPQRPWRARRGGLMRDAREWARHVASDVRCGAQGLCLPWIGVIGRSHRNLMVTYPPTTGD